MSERRASPTLSRTDKDSGLDHQYIQNFLQQRLIFVGNSQNTKMMNSSVGTLVTLL